MPKSRWPKSILLAPVVALALIVLPTMAAQGGGGTQEAEYVVVYDQGVSLTAAREAVEAAGGQIVKENTDVGVATVTSGNATFLTNVAAQAALDGAARNAPVGRQEPLKVAKKDGAALTRAERAAIEATAADGSSASAVAAEPLAAVQWDMAQIHATAEGSYATQPGDHGVRVGILDSGIDGTHPDIAPNFDASLSRNFVTDIPAIDGPCEHASCVDPINEDDNGHGTHVAGSVAAALNGIGIAGVAPNVTLVNIRTGQDSGFLFLQPTVDALTYAANIGVDVVNMSYYIDPWRYNCPSNPADSATQQAEQRTIIEATNRALDYAYEHGVTLIALGRQRARGHGEPAARYDEPRLSRPGRTTPAPSTTRA